MTSAVQRFRQGVLALLAFSRPVDDALATRYLSPEQMRLFKSMLRSEQLHSLNVLRAVLTQVEHELTFTQRDENGNTEHTERTEGSIFRRAESTTTNTDDTPHDLAVAALLHDVGKTRYPLAVWQKTLAVLIRAAFPKIAHRLSNGNPRNLIARPFVVNVHHPRWSAELLKPVGTSEGALWLVEHHADRPEAWAGHPHVELLKRLKVADDAN